jgi:hypothetical protein
LDITEVIEALWVSATARRDEKRRRAKTELRAQFRKTLIKKIQDESGLAPYMHAARRDLAA